MVYAMQPEYMKLMTQMLRGMIPLCIGTHQCNGLNPNAFGPDSDLNAAVTAAMVSRKHGGVK